MLTRFAEQGVTRVVCTPHLRATDATEAPFVRNAALLAELRQRTGPVPALSLGWEIMLDRPGADFTRTSVRLGGAPAVLVEFPRSGIPPRAADELYRIRMSGVVPVVAHPERYVGASVTHVREWRAAGAVMQGDATFLLGSGCAASSRARCSRRAVRVLASDNHGDARSLGAAREWLASVGATEHAELLTPRTRAACSRARRRRGAPVAAARRRRRPPARAARAPRLTARPHLQPRPSMPAPAPFATR